MLPLTSSSKGYISLRQGNGVNSKEKTTMKYREQNQLSMKKKMQTIVQTVVQTTTTDNAK